MSKWHLARNYQFAGVAGGLHEDPDRRDVALIVSDRSATAAGVFTQNQVCAAPVQLCRERLPSEDARGVVICAGNANACTGEQGMRDARRMAEVAAEVVNCRPEQILVCSTGVIGHLLPMPRLESGIHLAGEMLGSDEGSLQHAAHAILTTDTRIKVATRSLTLNGIEVHLTGLAKGTAMIGPNMATMLAFVFMDAPVASEDLQAMARRCTKQTFNCIRVEGHTSTNDTLLFFANGEGERLSDPGLTHLESCAREICEELACAIVADAEGADHLITIDVEGLRDDDEAYRVAKAVADSALVKTGIFGADPNWGRIVCAAGYAGVPFKEEQLSLWMGDMLLYHLGQPQPFDVGTASAYLKNNREVSLRLRFTLGQGRSRLWTCDLTYEYVRLNAEYTT